MSDVWAILGIKLLTIRTKSDITSAIQKSCHL